MLKFQSFMSLSILLLTLSSTYGYAGYLLKPKNLLRSIASSTSLNMNEIPHSKSKENIDRIQESSRFSGTQNGDSGSGNKIYYMRKLRKKNGIKSTENTLKKDDKESSFETTVNYNNINSIMSDYNPVRDNDIGENEKILNEEETIRLLLREISKSNIHNILVEALNKFLEENTIENVINFDDFIDIVGTNTETVDFHTSTNINEENEQNPESNENEFKNDKVTSEKDDRLNIKYRKKNNYEVTEHFNSDLKTDNISSNGDEAVTNNNSNDNCNQEKYQEDNNMDAFAKKIVPLLSFNITLEQAILGLIILFLNCVMMCCICINRVGVCGWLFSLCRRKMKKDDLV